MIFSRTFYANAKWSVIVVQFVSCVWLFATPWSATLQASLSCIISLSLLKLMSIESVMPSNHLILCLPLLLLPSVFPNITVFSSESALHILWPKYWSCSISPFNEYSGLFPLGLTGFWYPCCLRESQESSPAPQFESISSLALSLLTSLSPNSPLHLGNWAISFFLRHNE